MITANDGIDIKQMEKDILLTLKTYIKYIQKIIEHLVV